jgi:hypothetical protein
MTNPTRSPLKPTFGEARIFVRRPRETARETEIAKTRAARTEDWTQYCVAQHLI